MKHLFRASERNLLDLIVLVCGLLIVVLILPRLIWPTVAGDQWPGLFLLMGVTLTLRGTAELLPPSRARLAGLLRITYLLCAIAQLVLIALAV